MIEVNTFDELIEVIRSKDLTPEQTNQLLWKSIKTYVVNEPQTKDELIERLQTFWNKYKDVNLDERPIFIDPDPLDKEDF